MACYHPLTAWRTRSGEVTFKQGEGKGFSFPLPCGQCIGCRLERSRQWAIRIMHESQMHESSCFLTLTYDNDSCPRDASLNKKHFQDFMKRLRRRVGKVRYFHCGEYGDQYNRPHYHACIFGYDFPDKVLWSESRGNSIFVSNELSHLWQHGFSCIGDLTFESAAYVARYCVKKVTGRNADEHYKRFDSETGEIFWVEPEYVTMSLKPAIGQPWLDKFGSDVFPSDSVVMRGVEMQPPKFYFRKLEKSDPDLYARLRRRRIKRASARLEDRSPERLKVRERVKYAQVKSLKRSLDQ